MGQLNVPFQGAGVNKLATKFTSLFLTYNRIECSKHGLLLLLVDAMRHSQVVLKVLLSLKASFTKMTLMLRFRRISLILMHILHVSL